MTLPAQPKYQTEHTYQALTWQRLEYDGLGRLVTERIRLPGTTGLLENARTTTYNAQGWKLTESV